LAAPTIDQAAAAHMLNTMDESYLASVKQEYESRRNVAVQALARLPGVRAHVPDGAFYLLAELPVADAEDFATFMLNDFSFEGKTVFVAPAGGFYMHPDNGRNQIRLAFVLNGPDTADAIRVLGEGLKVYQSRSH
jgi:aspartate aminotransferase